MPRGPFLFLTFVAKGARSLLQAQPPAKTRLWYSSRTNPWRFFSQTWESKVSVRDGAFPHCHLWQATYISECPAKYFSLPQSKRARLWGWLHSAEEWQDVQPTLKAFSANAVLLGMPLTEQHHFCTSKLSSAGDTVLGYLGDTEYTEWCFLLVRPV